jgi:hypothetical protein
MNKFRHLDKYKKNLNVYTKCKSSYNQIKFKNVHNQKGKKDRENLPFIGVAQLFNFNNKLTTIRIIRKNLQIYD